MRSTKSRCDRILEFLAAAIVVIYTGLAILVSYAWNLDRELALLSLVVPLGFAAWVLADQRHHMQAQDAKLDAILSRLGQAEKEEE